MIYLFHQLNIHFPIHSKTGLITHSTNIPAAHETYHTKGASK